MASLPLVVVVVMVAMLVHAGSVVAAPCGGAGFDLSSLSGRDYFFDVFGGPGVNNWTYAVNPCSALDQSVAPNTCGGFGAMFCQISRNAGTANHSLAVYNASATSWLALPGVGVQASIQDGEYCSTIKTNREVNLVFVCNASATTPYLSSVIEAETCHYNAVFQTAAACNAQTATGVHQPGDKFISSTCGAGIYDLSSLASQDLIFDAAPNATTGWAYYLRLCGQISSPSATKCTAQGPSMACQQSKSNASTSAYQLAVYNATSTDIYTLNSDGMTLSIQDGTYCSTIKAPRELSIQLVCDTTATTPQFVSLAEVEVCWYAGLVRTSAVCSRIDTVSSSSSSGSAASATGSSTAGATGAPNVSGAAAIAVSSVVSVAVMVVAGVLAVMVL